MVRRKEGVGRVRLPKTRGVGLRGQFDEFDEPDDGLLGLEVDFESGFDFDSDFDFEPLSPDEPDELPDDDSELFEEDPESLEELDEPESLEEPDEPESDPAPGGVLALEPRLSVLKNPAPLKVTPTGWNTFLTGRTSPDSGWVYSARVSSAYACWTSMVSPDSTNLYT